MRGRFDAVGCLMVAGVLAVVLFVLGGIGFGIASALHEEERVCTVDTKERLYTGESGTETRLYTEECGVLVVEDALFAGHFTAGDVYNGIEEGKTYEVTTRGYRVGFFSMFPNVIEAEEVRS